MAGTVQTVCFLVCLFEFADVVPYCSLSQDEIDAHVCAYVWMLDSLCPPSVYMEPTAGASRVASGPPSACASSPFEALKQGRLGMINGPAE